MRNISGSKVRKLLILASVLVLMLTLCGCRTRITNNDEVTNVMYDEEGWMQDEYDMRRDELGLSKAQKPIFTGLGSSDDEDYDEYYGGDEDFMEDYDPESYDDYSDADEPDTSENGSDGSGTQKQGTTSTTVKRKPVTKTTPAKDDTKIQVVLDAGTNGGTISKKKTLTVTVEKGGTYSSLTDPDKREGYTFKGWYTKKENGTKVTKKTKVTVTKKHKLYAQWEKTKEETKPETEPEKKTYTVTFDPNGGEISGGNASQTVEEGSTVSAPTAIRDGYRFLAWFSAAEGGTEFSDSAKVTGDQTWFAHWERDWEKTFTEAADQVSSEDKFDFFIEGSSSGKKKLIDACRGNIIDNVSDKSSFYVVRFIPDISDGKAESAKNEIMADEQYTDKSLNILLIDSEAVEGDNDTKLVYRMAILSQIYGTLDNNTVSEAASDLGYSGDLSKKIYVY